MLLFVPLHAFLVRPASCPTKHCILSFACPVLFVCVCFFLFVQVDVEGVEFDVCDSEDFLASLDRVGQIIYEFHTRLLKKPKGRKERCVEALAQKGFRLLMRTQGEEYVFARVTQDAVIEDKIPPGTRKPL